MKLRNKKTGEIMDDVQYRNYSTSDGFGLRMGDKEWEYHSLAEFNADWEDYKPVEPLIKDESMREAIRAWAKCCGWENFIVCNDHFNNCYLVGYKDNKSSRLEFNNTVAGASKKRCYTIAELCGEEEE